MDREQTSEPVPHDKLARLILEGTPDAVLFADHQGCIRFWNKGAERIFGFTAAEALGRSLDLIIPEKLRARHWAGYDQVLKTGVSRYSTDLLAVPAMHRDGHHLSCQFSIVMIHDEDNRITGFASIMRDVSAQREKERTLINKLRELNRPGIVGDSKL